jgi:hypothetical protein
LPGKIDHVGRLYTVLLCFLAVGMANLNILMSVGSILLFLLWIYNPGPVEGFRRLRRNVPALLLIGLFLMHLIWLMNTSDFQYAFKDIRIKLPLLIFGLVFGSAVITKQQKQLVFIALGSGVWIAIITGYYHYFSHDGTLQDYRSIVTGISHIRLSVLMVILTAAIIYYWNSMPLSLRLIASLTVANILIFFNLIQAATGTIILIVLLLWSAGYYASRRMNKPVKMAFYGGLVIILAAAGLSTYGYYQRYFVSQEDTLNLARTTAQGNPYYHVLDAAYVENGHYIFINICSEEMQEAWNERSEMKILDTDDESEDRIGVLTRYLASKGLTKDRAGVEALTELDVSRIEQGIPSVIYAEKSGLELRFHTFLFGIHTYSISGNASGLSFLQRVVYWNAAVNLIAKSPILGTGTGDVKTAFLDVYDEMNTNLEPRYRNRAHNQFLTFFVSFGVLGFLYFILLFLYPIVYSRPDYLYMAFLMIAFVSCLTEDTLETQAGATIFAFFYGLFASRDALDA